LQRRSRGSPLNAIALTVEMMRVQAVAPPAHTALLGREVQHLTSLLDSLLEYSRASFGTGMMLQRAQVDLAAACADWLRRSLEPTARLITPLAKPLTLTPVRVG